MYCLLGQDSPWIDAEGEDSVGCLSGRNRGGVPADFQCIDSWLSIVDYWPRVLVSKRPPVRVFFFNMPRLQTKRNAIFCFYGRNFSGRRDICSANWVRELFTIFWVVSIWDFIALLKMKVLLLQAINCYALWSARPNAGNSLTASCVGCVCLRIYNFMYLQTPIKMRY